MVLQLSYDYHHPSLGRSRKMLNYTSRKVILAKPTLVCGTIRNVNAPPQWRLSSTSRVQRHNKQRSLEISVVNVAMECDSVAWIDAMRIAKFNDLRLMRPNKNLPISFKGFKAGYEWYRGVRKLEKPICIHLCKKYGTQCVCYNESEIPGSK